MRFLITASRNPDAPASDHPVSDDEFVAYMRFNEEMHRAGVLVASEGVNPSRKGARVVASKGKRVLTDGPFTESKELVGGYMIIQARSLDEAVDLIRPWLRIHRVAQGVPSSAIEVRRLV